MRVCLHSIVAEGQSLLRELMGVFGLRAERPEKGGQAAPFIQLLIDLRRELREQKLWAYLTRSAPDWESWECCSKIAKMAPPGAGND